MRTGSLRETVLTGLKFASIPIVVLAIGAFIALIAIPQIRATTPIVKAFFFEYPSFVPTILASLGIIFAYSTFMYLQKSMRINRMRYDYLEDAVYSQRYWRDKRPSPRRVFSESEKEAIKAEVLSGFRQDIFDNLKAEWESKFSINAIRQSHIDSLRSKAMELEGRLTSELGDINIRANLNLVFGLFVATAGMGLLFWFASQTLADSTSMNLNDIVIRFAIRFSVVLFATVLSFFFLRLYRHGIFEIKYFQNEITNAQSRALAVELAVLSADSKLIEKIALEMVRTERNFILKRGETTVDLTRSRLEAEIDQSAATTLERMFGRRGSDIPK